jgi:hypothetical protein
MSRPIAFFKLLVAREYCISASWASPLPERSEIDTYRTNGLPLLQVSARWSSFISQSDFLRLRLLYLGIEKVLPPPFSDIASILEPL